MPPELGSLALERLAIVADPLDHLAHLVGVIPWRRANACTS
jgi:hypothetical protein